jgi:hypothetical protein
LSVTQRDVSLTLRTAGSEATAHTRRAVLYTEAKKKGLVLPPVFSPRAVDVVWDGPAAPLQQTGMLNTTGGSFFPPAPPARNTGRW